MNLPENTKHLGVAIMQHRELLTRLPQLAAKTRVTC